MFKYNGIEVQTTPGRTITCPDVTIEIGEPFIIASKDESHDEGEFVTPQLYNFNGNIFVNWSFTYDGNLDRNFPCKANGRISRDGGKTWERQKTLLPPGAKYMTDRNEVTSYWGCFEIPGRPGEYLVPTWRSYDNGLSWEDYSLTYVTYPGTRGVDIYDKEFVNKYRQNWRSMTIPDEPPEYLREYFNCISRKRFSSQGGLKPQVTHKDGTIYSLIYGRYLECNFKNITDWDNDYWSKLNLNSSSVFIQESKDKGRTWNLTGIIKDMGK